MAEAFHWREGLSRSLRQAPGFYAVIVAGMAVGAGLNLTGIGPIKALFVAALLNGLAASPILVLMLLTSRTGVLGRWRSGRLSLTLVAVAALVMTVLPAWYLLSCPVIPTVRGRSAAGGVAHGDGGAVVGDGHDEAAGAVAVGDLVGAEGVLAAGGAGW